MQKDTKKQHQPIIQSTSQQEKDAAMQAAALKFYNVLQTHIEEQIEKYLKDNNFYRLVVGQVTKVNYNSSSCSVDIGDMIVNNILNKSDRELFRGDTVTILDRYGSNFRNSFVICVNGKEIPLQGDIEVLQDIVKDLQSQINSLKSTS